ncbi:hypothetical protein KEM56_000210 [Ascosphaera pollenicola]|nr:hypothetical protein KEM56_000210 [Ascosphaera pollenicola]
MEAIQPYELPWADLDRGLVSNHGRVLHKCSERFLTELCSSLIEASENPDIFTKGSRPSLIFQAGLEEIDRLERHPSLFPEPLMMIRFLALADEIRKSKEKEERLRGMLVEANQISQEEDEILDGINRPMFKRELKPWEQFLLKGSPGSGLTIPEHPPHMLFQVMPFAGALLRDRWLKTTRELEQKIKQDRLPPEVAKRPVPDQEFATPSTDLDIQYSQHRFPNLYKEKAGPQIRDYDVTDRLENFSDLIDGLEGRPYLGYLTRPNTHVLLYRSINPKLAQEETNHGNNDA